MKKKIKKMYEYGVGYTARACLNASRALKSMLLRFLMDYKRFWTAQLWMVLLFIYIQYQPLIDEDRAETNQPV